MLLIFLLAIFLQYFGVPLFADVDNVWSVVKLQQKLDFPKNTQFRYDTAEGEELKNLYRALIELLKELHSEYTEIDDNKNGKKVKEAEETCARNERNASKICEKMIKQGDKSVKFHLHDYKECDRIWFGLCTHFDLLREKEREFEKGKKNIDISFYDQPTPSCNYTVRYYQGMDKDRGDQYGYGSHHLLAEGTYNKPMRQPQCLYDVWIKAEEVANYEIVRYCAKAYFYRGYDFDADAKNNYQTEFTTHKRKGWRLYLIHGNLACSISNNPSKDAKLLAKRFDVSLMQKRCVDPSENEYKDFILSSYTDDNRDGEFMLAGVLGSLDLECPGVEKHQLLLQVGHYCTRDKTYETLLFDLSFEKKQVADDNVHEEDKVVVELKEKMMRMATGHKIFAIESPQWYDYVNSHQKRDPSKEKKGSAVVATIALLMSQNANFSGEGENSTEYYDDDDDEYGYGKNGTKVDYGVGKNGTYDEYDLGKNGTYDVYGYGKSGTEEEDYGIDKDGTNWEEYGVGKNGTEETEEEDYGIDKDEDDQSSSESDEGEEDDNDEDDDENREQIKELLKKA